MIVYCVRIGNKYGPEYEDYIEKKLKYYDVRWIRESFDPRVVLQWNKMLPMSLDIDEPVCVIDIDLFLINDYHQLFEYPIARGEFLAIPGWWNPGDGYTINGGFFKYWPKDCKPIFDKFMLDPIYWQQYYIKAGITTGPVNGEQYFVEDSVKEYLALKLIPDSWVTRWATREIIDNTLSKEYSDWERSMNLNYIKRTGNEYCYLAGEFHLDIKLVHFTNSNNKPHKWEGYNDYVDR
jgi:hypothetical protein